MIIKNAELETVCGITSVLPKNECPEFAFSGKSNNTPPDEEINLIIGGTITTIGNKGFANFNSVDDNKGMLTI